MASHRKELSKRKPSKRLAYIAENRNSSICPLCNKVFKSSSCSHHVGEVQNFWNAQYYQAVNEVYG